MTTDALARRTRLSARLIQKYRAGTVVPKDRNRSRLERALNADLNGGPPVEEAA